MSTLNSDKSRKKYKIILNKNISRKKQIATTKSNCAISQNRRKKNDRLRFQILIIQKIRSTIVAEMGPLKNAIVWLLAYGLLLILEQMHRKIEASFDRGNRVHSTLNPRPETKILSQILYIYNDDNILRRKGYPPLRVKWVVRQKDHSRGLYLFSLSKFVCQLLQVLP